jgi:hypothetical protein
MMNSGTIPLSEFSMSEKLALLESLWADLADADGAFESPAWHADVVKGRIGAMENEPAGHAAWEDARMRLRGKLR